MSDEASFGIPQIAQAEETTGRYVITFREDAEAEGMAELRRCCGVAKLPRACDFADSALDTAQLEAAGGAEFPTLGVAVVTMDDEAASNAAQVASEDSAILDIEPERIFYALQGGGTLPLSYLRGYRDAVDHLFQAAASEAAEGGEGESEALAVFDDDARSTWGIRATRALESRYTGRGIKIAVLDTGLDLQHPDFRGRAILSRSFISGEAVQDGNGHGTHCIGTACGRIDMSGRRYGVAGNSTIFAGKVLSNAGSGATSGILAGMEWAVTNGCHIVSMSLGNMVATPSTAYEAVGRRAMQRGTLIVAAAGNHRPRGPVGQPANSPSILAVGAVDNRLRLASFSCRSGSALGANVDIAAPGVKVYSSWPMKTRYNTINGTSMATPHVAGIAALYAEAYRARGAQLWQLLVSRARRLPIPTADVGAGLAIAPV